jgi:molybdate transport system substrate-binding protein
VRGAAIAAALPVAALAFANVVAGAELRVLSAAAVKGPLAETVAAFERETGQHVALEFATAGQVESRIVAGEGADLVLNTRPRLDALVAKSGRAGVVHDLGTVRVGVAVRGDAPRPDVSSVDAFRTSLLAASSVAYTNPAAGGTAGTYFAGVLERLGIAEAMAPKRRLAADGLDVMRKVVSGEAELGITQVSEIYLADRSTFVGALPESLQLLTTYAVFVPDGADPAARVLASALTNDASRARFRAAGFE